MGLQIRDERQMKALTGLSQAQFAHLLPVCSDIYQTTQQQTYEKGVESPEHARAHRVVAPKANCRRWLINCCSSSITTRPLRPLMS
jgi:hypothetical protein